MKCFYFVISFFLCIFVYVLIKYKKKTINYMAKGYIYKYTYPNGKVYIGQTRVSVEERHKQHMWASKHDDDRRCLCEVAIAKYGEPILETIEVVDVDDANITDLCKLLDEAEIKWIRHYNSTDTSKGYNVKGGGTHKTPERFILDEKYDEIWKNGKYEEDIDHVWEVLSNIGIKICETNEPLNKEEKHVWYKIRFDSPYFETTSFCKLYNSVLNNDSMKIYLDLDELLGIEEDKLKDIQTFDKIIEQAIRYYAQYESGKVWDVVVKNKDRFIKEYFEK